ncbi:MAG: aminotransferase class I/II-fold pyridoxal phosphate-dependent enzyme, partial [Solirubrobacteraceae bacterium]
VLTPRAHNPTGASISPARSRQLREALADHPDLLVIENDHSALVAGAEHSPVATACEHWAVVRSVSKALSPDLRLAVVAGDPTTIALVEGRQQLGAGWVSHILQQLTHRLWSDPRTDALLARATATYAERRTALINALAEHGIPARGDSGLNVYIEVPEEGTAAQAMLAKGWALRTGEGYRLSAHQPFLRATTAALEPDDTTRLAHDLAAVLRPSRASRRA